MQLLDELFGLNGTTALVTGAGSGLGRVIAEGYAQVGARVVCADLLPDRVDEVVTAIRANGGQAEACVLDVWDEAAVAQLAKDMGGQPLDVLVNFAGVATPPTMTHELSTADWQRGVGISLTGTFFMTRALLPNLRANGGSIINVASILGLGGYYPDFPASSADYAASKAGVIGFTRQVAVEYAAEKVRANVIAPGWHGGTRLGDGRRKERTKEEEERFYTEMNRRIPMKRRGDASEILGLALYLASPASAYLTGQVITQDGGWTAC
ncbi:SDR family NAD(P)-dependent oxidoreductase [Novosphingobium taihuense]|uniref:Gluconate 5-dehydrogenase n=1 Tax=Novosphingobium taihuense TaxID=260085 RepID=A0A7W7AC36_9SPHN|nr:SDR family NAD(P)-dependent oxidoreductase [Novosphingobium taihuense]MBB4614290.1 gluconate 5-dehydrogenase [Novosphingobium taihuense]TWH87137.1 gluconate 5-dehydrogenase/3-oxoacyl-[acyl-carrier protein] reductase [Novosphingobium taihuense]